MKNFINIKDISVRDLKKILLDAKKRKKHRIGGDVSVKHSDISRLNLDESTDESQVPAEIDEMIDQKEAQKMMTDNSSIEDKLDKEIQKLKELKNEQLVAV